MTKQHQLTLLRLLSVEQLAEMYPSCKKGNVCMSRVKMSTPGASWSKVSKYTPHRGTELICNRTANHNGPHIAWGFEPLVAWPNKESQNAYDQET